MKRNTSTFHAEDAQTRVSLLDLERETRRLFAEHARDPLATLAIALDAQVRLLAHRIAARLRARSSALH